MPNVRTVGISSHVLPQGLLSVGPCPKKKDVEGEVKLLTFYEYDVVVSMLTPEDVVTLGLQDEGRLCRQYGIEYLNLPVPDQSPPPDTVAATAFFKDLLLRYARGQRIYIHCMHGLGRAPSAVASVLVLMGMDVDESFEMVRQVRGYIQITPGQREWVMGLKVGARPMGRPRCHLLGDHDCGDGSRCMW